MEFIQQGLGQEIDRIEGRLHGPSERDRPDLLDRLGRLTCVGVAADGTAKSALLLLKKKLDIAGVLLAMSNCNLAGHGIPRKLEDKNQLVGIWLIRTRRGRTLMRVRPSRLCQLGPFGLSNRSRLDEGCPSLLKVYCLFHSRSGLLKFLPLLNGFGLVVEQSFAELIVLSAQLQPRSGNVLRHRPHNSGGVSF